MIVTISYGVNGDPETIRNVVSIEEDTEQIGPDGSAQYVLIKYLESRGYDVYTKTRRIRYTEYVTITIH